MTSVVSPRVQARLAGVNGYHAGGHLGDEAGKLSSNEMALGASPRVRAALQAVDVSWHRYPDAEGLRTKIASHMGFDPRNVLVTNGSDELVYLLSLLLLDRTSRVVLGSPCYAIDKLVAHLYDAEVCSVQVRDGSHDLDEMLAYCDRATLAWLPSPHNPTGVSVELDALERFLGQVPRTCVVVLDEAYREFAPAEKRPNVHELLARYPNLVVQRTFSKAYGLAGLRVGYAVTSARLIEMLQKIRPPFSVNAAAIAGATAALEDTPWRDWSVDLVTAERTRFEEFLRDRGVTFFASDANFVTAFFGDRCNEVSDALGEFGLSARPGADLGLPGWLRITIGAPAQMATLRMALATVLDGDPGGSRMTGCAVARA